MMRFYKSKFLITTFAIIALIFAYFFSEGYAYRLMRLDKISYGRFDEFYHPVVWLNGHSRFFGFLITWDENLWYSDSDELEKFFRRISAASVNTNSPNVFNVTNQLNSTRKP